MEKATAQNAHIDKFDLALAKGDATWWHMELPSGHVFFGDAKATMLGGDPKDFNHYTDFTNIVYPDDRDKTMLAMKDHLEGKKALYEAEYRIQKKDGEYLRFYDVGKVIAQKGERIEVMGFVWRINEEVDVEAQKQEFRDLVSSGDHSILKMSELIGKK